MHAPDDYDRHRRHHTWNETHHKDAADRRHARRRTAERHRNRTPGRFGKVNWEAYQHDELYNMIMKADPRQMYERARAWKDLAGAIEHTTGEVQRIVQQVMGSWQGQAAVNAGSATTGLMQWAGAASHTAGTVAARMSDYSEAVATAQRRMPEPAFATAERNFRDGYTVTMTGGPADAVFLRQLLSDGMVSHEQARARKAEAVAVMETYESHSRAVHDEMPHFTDPPPTTTATPAWTPADDPGGGGGAGGGGAAEPGGGTSAVPGANASTTAASFLDPVGPGGTGLPGGTTFGGPGSLSGSGGAEALRTGSPFGAGGAGGAAGLGAGALAGRGPGGVLGGPGGMVGGGAGARGGAGAYGGMPMGRGAGEEDGEHTNKYDEGLDLFDDLPPAYPPVFGA